MAFLFPRVTYNTPVRCGMNVTRSEFAPLFSLFDDSLNELHRASLHARKQFNPRFDVKEAKDSYSVEAEVPGVNQKDLTIEFTDEHTLTIKGRTDRRTESGSPAAVEAAPEKPALEDATPTTEKSHQPTVEDEEAPANASATAEQPDASATPTPAPATETEKAPEAPRPRYWISERKVGEFSRSFNFPARVDQEAVTASLKDGILSVLIPKAAVPESRRINIE